MLDLFAAGSQSRVQVVRRLLKALGKPRGDRGGKEVASALASGYHELEWRFGRVVVRKAEVPGPWDTPRTEFVVERRR